MNRRSEDKNDLLELLLSSVTDRKRKKTKNADAAATESNSLMLLPDVAGPDLPKRVEGCTGSGNVRQNANEKV